MSVKHKLRDLYLSARGELIKLFIRSAPPASTDPASVRSILVIRTDRIGDIVVSLPAIRALNEAFPKADIKVLVRPDMAGLISGETYINTVIPYHSFWRSISILRRIKFDMAVDLIMDYSIKTAIIAMASGAKVRAGFDIGSRGRFFNITVAPDPRQKHMSEHVLDIPRTIAEHYGVSASVNWDPQPRLTVTPEALASAEYIFKINGINREDTVIAIHPGGYFPSQRWMPGSFAELANRLIREYSAKIVLIGGSSDNDLIKTITSAMRVTPTTIIGRPLDITAGVISISKLLICNNSGLLHIASAVGTPTVSTMGPTVPYLWYPMGKRNKVIRHELSCSPCGQAKCSALGHECMNRISVYEMESAAISLLDDTENAGKDKAASAAPRIAAEKILVINLGGIGDIILSTPALRALKAAYPESKLYALCVSRAKELVSRMKLIDEAFYLDLGNSPARIAKDAKVLSCLRNMNIDLAINMRTIVSGMSALKMKALLKIISPVRTAGRDTDGRGQFFDIRIPETRLGEKSEMEYDIDLVEALGAKVYDRKPEIPRDDTSQKKVDDMLSRYMGISESAVIIGVHPGGKPSHRWPPEKYAALIDAISGKMEAKFIITGDAADAGAAKDIIGRSKADIVDSSGKLSLTELSAVIRRCKLFISNDTAAMHIAAILKVPLVAIFGPGYLERFDPRNVSDNVIVIKKEAPCSPCDKAECNRPVCLDGIMVEEVAAAAIKLLKR